MGYPKCSHGPAVGELTNFEKTLNTHKNRFLFFPNKKITDVRKLIFFSFFPNNVDFVSKKEKYNFPRALSAKSQT